MAGSNRKKQRKPKTSAGVHGATKHPLTELEKALLGKGLMRTMHHVPCKSNYKGVVNVSTPFDKAQVDENKRLYPHLFPPEERI